MPILYDNLISGNTYKIRLLIAKLGLSVVRIELDLRNGDTRTADFLALNPNGRVPALALEDGTVLAESDAILVYLAEGTPYWPDTRLARAQALQWMFFEQYSHEPYVAVVRHWRLEGHMTLKQVAEMPDRVEKGYDALRVMQNHLANRKWFVGDHMTVADIALYAYTHVAHEGGFELEIFPAVEAWLERVAADPGHVPMDWTPPSPATAS